MADESAGAASLPYVSVIIPTLNRLDLLKRTLESLQQQTYPVDRFEVIVVDNGSRDGTVDWIQETAWHTPFQARCFVNHDSSARVPAASRNLGLQHAQGDIVAFTDSDCVVVPGWIEAGVKAFSNGVAIVRGPTIPNPNQSRPAIFKTIDAARSSPAFFETCNVFYRRDAIDQVGGFHRDFIVGYAYPFFGEDIDVAYRVKKDGYETAFAPDAVVMHHIVPQSIRQWLAEPKGAFTWPYIVKKHPEVRSDVLFLRYFVNQTTALFDLGLLGVILAIFVSGWFVLLAVPAMVVKWRDGGRHLDPFMRLIRFVASLVRAALIFAVLLAGSIWFRRLVI